MALRSLELRKEIDAKNADLQRSEEKLANLQTREAEVIGKVEDATAETRESVEQEVNDFIEEKKSVTAEVESLRDAIASLEKELEELEAKQPSDNDENVERKVEKMSEMITRNSPEYVDAFARYIKTGSDKELRSLLTENVSGGVVAVPEIVENTIKTAWDKTGLMSRVRKTYIKGNIKVGFEISATGAVKHVEGTAAPDEEQVVLGIKSLPAVSLKKWLTISDECLDMTSSEFLAYVYAEITYRIAKAAEKELIDDIKASPASSSATKPGVKQISAAPALGTVAQAVANLSDEAANPVIVMNKLTYAAFKKAQYEANYAADIFEGLPVEFSSELPAYSAASEGTTYMIVGDFGHGAQANFPNGDEITIKVDELSLAEKDLVKFVGREYVGIGVVAPLAFVNVKKESGEE